MQFKTGTTGLVGSARNPSPAGENPRCLLPGMFRLYENGVPRPEPVSGPGRLRPPGGQKHLPQSEHHETTELPTQTAVPTQPNREPSLAMVASKTAAATNAQKIRGALRSCTRGLGNAAPSERMIFSGKSLPCSRQTSGGSNDYVGTSSARGRVNRYRVTGTELNTQKALAKQQKIGCFPPRKDSGTAETMTRWTLCASQGRRHK